MAIPFKFKASLFCTLGLGIGFLGLPNQIGQKRRFEMALLHPKPEMRLEVEAAVQEQWEQQATTSNGDPTLPPSRRLKGLSDAQGM